MSSWLDTLPSTERMKIRQRLRSPAEYERLREKVKGPEDLEKELEKQDAVAEASFALETEPRMQESARAQVERDIREQGIESVLEQAGNLSPEARSAIEQGKFIVAIASHPDTHDDRVTIAPEGNIAEKAPIVSALSDRYVAQLATKPNGEASGLAS